MLSLSRSILAAGVLFQPILAERPLAKVIKLLEDMTKQLEAERTDDDAVSAKMSCWCDKNREEKEGVIKVQSAEMERQDAAAKGAFGAIQKLEAKRNEVYDGVNVKKKEVQELQDQCLAEYSTASKADQEVAKTINALKAALTILGKHNSLSDVSLLQQLNSSTFAKFRGEIEKLVEDHNILKAAETSAEGLVRLQQFLDTTSKSRRSEFLQQPGFQSYASQSGSIFGLLSQMLEDFEGKKSASVKEEEARREACEQGIASGKKEVSLMQEQVNSMDARLGETAATEAEAKKAYDTASALLADATEFLEKLNAQCAQNKADYESRTKSRNEEILAIGETIKILDSDEAFAATGRALGTSEKPQTEEEESFLEATQTSFLQTKLRSQDVFDDDLSPLEKAAHILSEHNEDAHMFLIQQLVRSTTSTNNDAMKKVQAAIDQLVAEMKEQQKQEVKDRDLCLKQLDDVDADMRVKTAEKEKKTAESEELAALVSQLSDEVTGLASNIADMEKSVQEATEDRKEEHAEYLVVVKDHQETQAILQKAIDRMNEKYSNMKVKYAFAEQPVGAEFSPIDSTATTPGSGPVKFTNSGKTGMNKGGNQVIELLKKIQKDSADTEAAATQSEKDAEANYEDFMHQTAKALEKTNNAKDQKTEIGSESQKSKLAADSSIKKLGEGLFQLTEEHGTVHERCDFLLNNFDKRQSARVSEMEALAEAKHILSGMGGN